MIIIAIVLIILSFFGFVNCTESFASPVYGGSHEKKYFYEQKDNISPEYDIPEFNDKWITGDLYASYPQHPYVGNTTHNYYKLLPNPTFYKSHWGQRKLLLTEIDLLSQYFVKNPNAKNVKVVYAGAADGRHMPLLTKMFPEIDMHLYDPRPFYKGIESNRIHTYNQLFTEETAASWKNKNAIFISDIRTAPDPVETENNQRMQEKWVKIMNPVLTMLKYKLTYPNYDKEEYYKYIKGHIRLQCWSPPGSAETRLIIQQKDTQTDVDYPLNIYERNISWYNHIVRLHDFTNYKLHDRELKDYYPYYTQNYLNFDFYYEIMLLTDYLKAMNMPVNFQNITKNIEMINEQLMDKNAKFHNYLKNHKL